MLMIRPRRARVMPRSADLQSRYSDVRSVSSTSCHSSSRMRSSRLSRVTPALFTRMRGSPARALTSSSTAVTPVESRTSSTRPRSVPRRSQIAAAPASLVAVPNTRAPSCASRAAIAAPSPRDAPVTSAICPSSSGIRGVAARDERLLDRLGIVDRVHMDLLAALDAAVQARQHATGTAFHDSIDALQDHRAYRFHPAHGLVQLLDERGPDLVRIAML